MQREVSVGVLWLVIGIAGKMDVLIIMKMNGLIHLHSYIRASSTF